MSSKFDAALDKTVRYAITTVRDDKAKKDDADTAAWYLIGQIEAALKDRKVSEPLFDYAAEFFSALLDVREKPKWSNKDLLQVLGHRLHITKGRGKKGLSDEENLCLTARVRLLRGPWTKVSEPLEAKGLSADVAYRVLPDFALENAAEHGLKKYYTSKAYRTAFEARDAELEKLDVPMAELEAHSVCSLEELLAALTNTSALTAKQVDSIRSAWSRNLAE